MKRNITVQLDEATLRKARVAAARRGSSISRLVADQIDVLARQDDDYERAMQDALAELERGYDLGGGPYPARDAVYDR
ncbi:MAG TPA: DUF6364 family protein [Candidatus Sulfomarinibacteraceae bacterium]|nr:DUF6364 family protein [Candidatus Sulfomarinibacteraceae bacterium]